LSPRALVAHIISPEMLIAEVLSPRFIEPRIISPELLIIDVLSPAFISPHFFSGESVAVLVLSPHVLSPRLWSEERMLVEILSPHILGGRHGESESEREVPEGSEVKHPQQSNGEQHMDPSSKDVFEGGKDPTKELLGDFGEHLDKQLTKLINQIQNKPTRDVNVGEVEH
uniref:Secreted protein n=2 Tax=Toxocara canis TaxID=6265 RepID=A0A183U6P2_TOXCA